MKTITITIKQNNKSCKILLHFQHKTSESERIFLTLMATTCSVKNVLFRNYLFCQECIISFIDVCHQCLHKQREIKQSQAQHPITEMTKKDVEKDRLKSFVLYNAGESESGFTEWWKSQKDTDTVKVKIPHERHGLAKQSSNHAKQGVMADFLQFVDMNSQPNGRNTGATVLNSSFF